MTVKHYIMLYYYILCVLMARLTNNIVHAYIIYIYIYLNNVYCSLSPSGVSKFKKFGAHREVSPRCN